MVSCRQCTKLPSEEDGTCTRCRCIQRLGFELTVLPEEFVGWGVTKAREWVLILQEEHFKFNVAKHNNQLAVGAASAKAKPPEKGDQVPPAEKGEGKEPERTPRKGEERRESHPKVAEENAKGEPASSWRGRSRTPGRDRRGHRSPPTREKTRGEERRHRKKTEDKKEKRDRRQRSIPPEEDKKEDKRPESGGEEEEIYEEEEEETESPTPIRRGFRPPEPVGAPPPRWSGPIPAGKTARRKLSEVIGARQFQPHGWKNRGRKKVEKQIAYNQRMKRTLKRKKDGGVTESSGSSSGSQEEGESLESSEDVFEEAHKVRTIGRKAPGLLAKSTVREMQRQLLTSAGTMAEGDRDEIPPVALQYFRNLHHRLSGGIAREALTFSWVLDMGLRGRIAEAMDCAAQMKSIQLSAQGANWSVAQRVELVPPEQGLLSSRAEAQAAAKESRDEQKMRAGLREKENKGKGDYASSSWRDGQQKGKGKGKDKGKNKKGGGKEKDGDKKDS